MNKVLIPVLVLILLGAGAFYVYDSQKNSSMEPVSTQTEEVSPTGTEAVEETPKVEAAMEKGEVKTFNVTAKSFSFSVKEMKVKQGDTVKVVFSNTEGTHDWVLDEFKGAKAKILAAGETETVEFVADKKGTFEYYCSVGAHRAMGMKGNLIVE